MNIALTVSIFIILTLLAVLLWQNYKADQELNQIQSQIQSQQITTQQPLIDYPVVTIYGNNPYYDNYDYGYGYGYDYPLFYGNNSNYNYNYAYPAFYGRRNWNGHGYRPGGRPGGHGRPGGSGRPGGHGGRGGRGR